MDPTLYENSAADAETMRAPAFVHDSDFRRMETGMRSAVVKFRALLKDRPGLEGVPFHADRFDLYDHRALVQFPEAAGILRVASRESEEKQFRLVENTWARVKLPGGLAGWCIT